MLFGGEGAQVQPDLGEDRLRRLGANALRNPEDKNHPRSEATLTVSRVTCPGDLRQVESTSQQEVSLHHLVSPLVRPRCRPPMPIPIPGGHTRVEWRFRPTTAARTTRASTRCAASRRTETHPPGSRPALARITSGYGSAAPSDVRSDSSTCACSPRSRGTSGSPPERLGSAGLPCRDRDARGPSDALATSGRSQQCLTRCAAISPNVPKS